MLLLLGRIVRSLTRAYGEARSEFSNAEPKFESAHFPDQSPIATPALASVDAEFSLIRAMYLPRFALLRYDDLMSWLVFRAHEIGLHEDPRLFSYRKLIEYSHSAMRSLFQRIQDRGLSVEALCDAEIK